MRNYLVVMVATICLVTGLATAARAQQNVNWREQEKMMKAQQKLERHALLVQQANRKMSWKHQQVNSTQRDQAKHQMQREMRDLKQKQKDQLQDMKDRQKGLSQMQHTYNH